jgi:hypothetical protein
VQEGDGWAPGEESVRDSQEESQEGEQRGEAFKHDGDGAGASIAGGMNARC